MKCEIDTCKNCGRKYDDNVKLRWLRLQGPEENYFVCGTDCADAIDKKQSKERGFSFQRMWYDLRAIGEIE